MNAPLLSVRRFFAAGLVTSTTAPFWFLKYFFPDRHAGAAYRAEPLAGNGRWSRRLRLSLYAGSRSGRRGAGSTGPPAAGDRPARSVRQRPLGRGFGCGFLDRAAFDHPARVPRRRHTPGSASAGERLWSG
jgi:hypothetical protein